MKSRKNFVCEEKENIKLSTIRLIYHSKLKSNATRRKIKKNSHILTRSRTRNDLINCRIKGFSSRNFENEVRYLSGDFFLFSSPNLDFKCSLDVETSQEEE